jgi:phage tail-like protein
VGAGAGDKQVHANYHVTMKIEGVDGALLFYSFTPPSMSLDGPDFKTWTNQNGEVANSVGGGRQKTWSDIQLARGVDPDDSLLKWFEDVATKGAQEAKKDVVITVLDNANQPIRVWNLIGAVITQYNHSAVNAQTNEILVETITLKCQDCKLTKSG